MNASELLKQYANGRRDFSEVNLCAVDLGGADLRGICLCGAALCRAKLDRTDLREADLLLADLSKANLSEADLREADLSGAALAQAVINAATLNRATLSGADLTEAELRDTEMIETDLTKADLSDADLRGATLEGVQLGEANLWGADLRDCNLSNVDLSSSDLSRANLAGVHLDHTTNITSKWRLVWEIANNRLDQKKLNWLDLCHANLANANLRGADLHWSSFCNSDLSQSNLRGANLRDVNLTNADLTGADMRDVRLIRDPDQEFLPKRGVCFSQAVLRNVDLSGVVLTGIDLAGVDLSGADLRRADLRGANLCGAKLIKADLTDAKLRGAVLIGADLSEAKGVDSTFLENAVLGDTDCKERSSFPLDEQVVRTRAWIESLNALEKTVMERPPIPIAFVGSTGAGKSTLLNAILGKRVVPVSSMKPCTAALTVIRFVPEKVYRAQIEFLKRAEIDTDSSSPPDNILQYMTDDAPPLEIEKKSIRALKDELWHYLSGDGRYWKFVKSVDITGPFIALSNGVILIDLPGINDPNKAREQVTRKYLEDDVFIWILVNMKRGVTRDIYSLLHKQKLLLRALLSSRVTIIGTHADAFSVEDAIEEMDLPEDWEKVDVMRERSKRFIKQVRDDLRDIVDASVPRKRGDQGGMKRLRHALDCTQIYTAAAPICLQLQKRSQGDNHRRIDEMNHTGIPQIKRHLKTLSRHPQTNTAALEKELALYLEELADFCARRLRSKNHHNELDRGLARLERQLWSLWSELHQKRFQDHQISEAGFRVWFEAFRRRTVETLKGTRREWEEWAASELIGPAVYRKHETRRN